MKVIIPGTHPEPCDVPSRDSWNYYPLGRVVALSEYGPNVARVHCTSCGHAAVWPLHSLFRAALSNPEKGTPHA